MADGSTWTARREKPILKKGAIPSIFTKKPEEYVHVLKLNLPVNGEIRDKDIIDIPSNVEQVCI